MKRSLVCLMLLAACGSDEPTEEVNTEPPTVVPVEESAEQEPATEGNGTWSNARSFYASWNVLEEEVPLNEEFTLEVFLYEDDSRQKPLEDAKVVIDCRMPAHRHGMKHDVDLVHQGEGRYLAEGMLCHMLGHWEIYVDVTMGRLTERAQWDIELQ